MRYKQLIQGKLNAIENRLNSMDSSISRGDRNEYERQTVAMKTQIEEVQTLINTEDQD